MICADTEVYEDMRAGQEYEEIRNDSPYERLECSTLANSSPVRLCDLRTYIDQQNCQQEPFMEEYAVTTAHYCPSGLFLLYNVSILYCRDWRQPTKHWLGKYLVLSTTMVGHRSHYLNITSTNHLTFSFLFQMFLTKWEILSLSV